ncbi:type IV pilus assembly protein PilM [Tuwongella immobilis]|uniref:SHS2 domain-containing protein n=1 Tax=Tuwongella immobilis TaxID=692036 RepID=A0A6C2YNY7_9BACT|nr:type IV pilus assembly protein PilM [Tuwongella immobilis]VIP02909.1 Type IV pilus assembly protein PilM OS=Planctomyces brasiliensis (strain ATCC 49424 / DSM 5305 / JCM 21570 / NBRC 103401 / IFAM 1448) GN=Plabr_4060 PE=4 SV=1: PilM_2 [Tuwongella immobilis]VTS02815.1 Type IV pilus assembly protein PilM OS=Planctomyces brasiliensis (strain ATCC 49424 / DSM 5305 / JCM 21570 / NBRC 103401 / IFAM 1448) GN=Plabr_4060 PE=4 SV=1: PilM_2 [Tuwongella immobilis]
MAVEPGVWGIDVGQCALKAIRLERIDGVVTATAFEYIEHPKILSQPDADPEQLTREALEKFLERNPIKGDRVAIGVAGQSGLARFVKLPPVEEKNIPNVVKFEAKMQIPFPLDEVVWDYQRIGEGTVTDGFAMDTEIGLFAMKRDMISRVLAHFQAVDVEVHYVQMAPLALCNYIAYDLLNRGGEMPPEDDEEDDDDARGKKKCVVALDIGTESSSLVVTDSQKIIWQRPIPLGGNHFTKALSKEMKLTFAKAEHLKRNAAKSPDLAKILKSLKPVLNDFVGEVQRSLGYFTNAHRDSYIRYMMGLGSAFRLPGLQKFLSEKLSLDVRKPDNLRRLTGDSVVMAPNFTENVLSFPVAYGLALQAIGLGRITTNLLPPEIIVDRQIRGKKPWASAAAAMLILGSTVLTFGFAADYSALVDSKINGSLQMGDTALKEADTINKQVADKETDVKNTQNDVKTIIAGQDEQKNWIRLNQYINACLPIPGDTGNLLLPNQLQYWRSQQGLNALQDYRNRIAGGIPVDQPIDFKVRSSLAVVDIESMYCRYTDNLTTFFEKVKKETTDLTALPLNGMIEADANKPPEGAGWVIELQGTTFHEKGRDFLKSCLVANLANGVPVTGGVRFNVENLPPEQQERLKADPILNKVSHVFLYDVKEDKNPQPNTFVFIGQSRIDPLLAGGAAGAGGMPGGSPGMPPGAMMPGGEGGMPGMPGMDGGAGAEADPAAVAVQRIQSWTPVMMGGSGNAGMPGMMGGEGGPGRGMPGGMASMPGMSSGGGRPPISPGMPAGLGGPRLPGGPGMEAGMGGAGTVAPPNPKAVPRFEFIVMLVWKEPITSEVMPFGEGTSSTETPVSSGDK